ncbi:unnamed protein product [Nezara viridula]|uniref:Uncharacterized protein n=1 Tax=Nezara viridula TaxID=85310 RepID=A0A9P0HAE2_NEZVI|nr:unnamed protein product [Nezara viridula]
MSSSELTSCQMGGGGGPLGLGAGDAELGLDPELHPSETPRTPAWRTPLGRRTVMGTVVPAICRSASFRQDWHCVWQRVSYSILCVSGGQQLPLRSRHHSPNHILRRRESPKVGGHGQYSRQLGEDEGGSCAEEGPTVAKGRPLNRMPRRAAAGLRGIGIT